MLGRFVLASDLDGFSVGDERLFHVGRLVNYVLGCSGDARRLAEPVGALRVCEFRMRADEGTDRQLERIFECRKDGELGRMGEIVGRWGPIDLSAVRCAAPDHSRVFFLRRASASRRR